MKRYVDIYQPFEGPAEETLIGTHHSDLEAQEKYGLSYRTMRLLGRYLPGRSTLLGYGHCITPGSLRSQARRIVSG